MRGAQLRAPNDIVVTDVPIPDLGPGDLLLRVKATTICGTDVRIFSGKKTRGVRYPSIIGHEFSGVVTDTTPEITDFAEGDAISVDPVIPCGHCEYCLSGMENVCANRRAIGYEFDGSFAEYVRIPAAAVQAGNVCRIPAGTSWEAAALAEPLACCINGQNRVGIPLGSTVLVMGAGPIGLMHIRLAKHRGARTVIASELHEHRRDAAHTFGADLVCDPRGEDVQDIVLKATGGLGADVVILAIGQPKLAEEAVGLCRKGGKVSLFAGFSPGSSVNIDPNLVHYNEVAITGASALTRQDYRNALALVSQEEFGIDRLVTHRYPLEDMGEALAVAEQGTDSLKVAIQT